MNYDFNLLCTKKCINNCEKPYLKDLSFYHSHKLYD